MALVTHVKLMMLATDGDRTQTPFYQAALIVQVFKVNT